MPGLTLAYARGGAALETGPLTTALRAVEHFADYTTRALHAGPRAHVAATGYPEYPIAVHEDAGVLLVVGGRLYGPPDETSAATLAAMARAALATPPDVERLARWLAVVDGDFVLVAVSRADERVALLNDRLARLPVYYHLSAGRALASRPSDRQSARSRCRRRCGGLLLRQAEWLLPGCDSQRPLIQRLRPCQRSSGHHPPGKLASSWAAPLGSSR